MSQTSVMPDNKPKENHKQGLLSGKAVGRNFVVWRAWPEVGIVLLLLFTVLVVVLPNSNPPSHLSTASSAVFALPTSRIQSDLTRTRNGSHIVILLVDDKLVHRYPGATLLDQQGDMVYISLPRDPNDTAVTDFAEQLTNANVIFLLPS